MGCAESKHLPRNQSSERIVKGKRLKKSMFSRLFSLKKSTKVHPVSVPVKESRNSLENSADQSGFALDHFLGNSAYPPISAISSGLSYQSVVTDHLEPDCDIIHVIPTDELEGGDSSDSCSSGICLTHHITCTAEEDETEDGVYNFMYQQCEYDDDERLYYRYGFEELRKRRYDKRSSSELDIVIALWEVLQLIEKTIANVEAKIKRLESKRRELVFSHPSPAITERIRKITSLITNAEKINKPYIIRRCTLQREINIRETRAEMFVTFFNRDEEEQETVCDASSKVLTPIPEETEEDLEEYELGIFPTETNMSAAAVFYCLN